MSRRSPLNSHLSLALDSDLVRHRGVPGTGLLVDSVVAVLRRGVGCAWQAVASKGAVGNHPQALADPDQRYQQPDLPHDVKHWQHTFGFLKKVHFQSGAARDRGLVVGSVGDRHRLR